MRILDPLWSVDRISCLFRGPAAASKTFQVLINEGQKSRQPGAVWGELVLCRNMGGALVIAIGFWQKHCKMIGWPAQIQLPLNHWMMPMTRQPFDCRPGHGPNGDNSPATLNAFVEDDNCMAPFCCLSWIRPGNNCSWAVSFTAVLSLSPFTLYL